MPAARPVLDVKNKGQDATLEVAATGYGVPNASLEGQ